MTYVWILGWGEVFDNTQLVAKWVHLDLWNLWIGSHPNHSSYSIFDIAKKNVIYIGKVQSIDDTHVISDQWNGVEH